MGLSKSLNIIFAGTPEFSAVALQALLDSHHIVKAVYTQPDRPAGRGRKLTASPVKELALKAELPVHQPLTLRNEDEQKILANLEADVMVVVAYGLLLPLPVLNAPRLGCINIHGSLLPRWRGAAPIQRAILAGDEKTGITIMQMDEGLDTGPMLHTVETVIKADDTSETMYEQLAVLGAKAVLETLDQLAEGKANPIAQNNDLATYAHKIKKEEAELNWQWQAEALERAIRAFNPWPICFTHLDEHVLRIWQASVIPDATPANKQPGTLLQVSQQGIDVATGKNILRIQKLQLPGGRVLPVADILNARQLDFVVGKILGQHK
ncbi:MAG: methionyl-tRNA formyltransferase [Gammaproteobacteria bacterium]|nr:methionyl-tRNA formyltransferase [Gammaproteobacteria bacterium]